MNREPLGEGGYLISVDPPKIRDIMHTKGNFGCLLMHIIFLPQEQLKQQQWQQQQQQTGGGSVSPSGGSVPPQHRSLYQPLGPHHQHLASMGFDPRWLMMQSYMDPRMMSGRPPMDMPMHPGSLFILEFTAKERRLFVFFLCVCVPENLLTDNVFLFCYFPLICINLICSFISLLFI